MKASRLHEAAFYGDSKQVGKCLEAGFCPDEYDSSERSALHIAAANGHLECVKMLTTIGCSVNVTDGGGCTPVHVAARNGHLDKNHVKINEVKGTLTWLVENGGDYKIETPRNNTALTLARRETHSDVVTYLKKLDAKRMAWE